MSKYEYVPVKLETGAWIVKRTAVDEVEQEVTYLTHSPTGLVVLTRTTSHAVAAELQEEGEPSGLLKGEFFGPHEARYVRPS